MPQTKLEIALHRLSSTLGRGRVFVDNEDLPLAKRELKDASDALGDLRAAIFEENNDPAS